MNIYIKDIPNQIAATAIENLLITYGIVWAVNGKTPTMNEYWQRGLIIREKELYYSSVDIRKEQAISFNDKNFEIKLRELFASTSELFTWKDGTINREIIIHKNGDVEVGCTKFCKNSVERIIKYWQDKKINKQLNIDKIPNLFIAKAIIKACEDKGYKNIILSFNNYQTGLAIVATEKKIYCYPDRRKLAIEVSAVHAEFTEVFEKYLNPQPAIVHVDDNKPMFLDEDNISFKGIKMESKMIEEIIKKREKFLK